MSALDAALLHLPGWIRWLPGLVDVLLAGLLTWLLGRLALGVAGSWRPVPGEHWSERARRAWNPRLAPQIAAWSVAALFLVRSYVREHAVDAWPDWLQRALLVVVVEAAAMLVRFPVERDLRDGALTLRRHLRSGAAFRLVYFAPVYVAVLFGLSVPAGGGPAAWTLAGVGAALVVATGLGAALHLCRVLGILRPAGARLEGIVAASAARAGGARPRAWTLPVEMPNAFAFHALHGVAFTDRALEVLGDDALGAICDHEMGHLAEPAAVRWGRRAGLLPLLVAVAARPLHDTVGVVGLLVALAVAVLGAALAGRRSQVWEERADAAAHGHDHGEDEGRYARALLDLHVAGLMPAVVPGRRPSHPHLYDRLRRAGIAPDFPRPAPPPAGPRNRVAVVVLVIVILATAALTAVDHGFGIRAVDDRVADLWTLGTYGLEKERSVARLAVAAWRAGDLDQAERLYRAAAAFDAGAVWPLADEARLALARGRAEEARARLDEAERRVEAAGGEWFLSRLDVASLHGAREALGR